MLAPLLSEIYMHSQVFHEQLSCQGDYPAVLHALLSFQPQTHWGSLHCTSFHQKSVDQKIVLIPGFRIGNKRKQSQTYDRNIQVAIHSLVDLSVPPFGQPANSETHSFQSLEVPGPMSFFPESPQSKFKEPFNHIISHFAVHSFIGFLGHTCAYNHPL